MNVTQFRSAMRAEYALQKELLGKMEALVAAHPEVKLSAKNAAGLRWFRRQVAQLGKAAA
jgi:hypothetical protein